MAHFDVDNYIDTQERIVRFWSEYPQGSILTELMSDPHDWTTVRYKATVYKHPDDARPAATGFAFEVAGTSHVNKTSHEENCETSAIGRALANMGYATSSADRPSRQEMEKVQRGRGDDSSPPAPRPMAPPPPRPTAPAAAVVSTSDRRYEVKPWHSEFSQAQRDTILRMAYEVGMADEQGNVDESILFVELDKLNAAGAFGDHVVVWPNLTKGQASAVIDWLKDRQNALKGRL